MLRRVYYVCFCAEINLNRIVDVLNYLGREADMLSRFLFDNRVQVKSRSWRELPWLQSASIPKVYELNESLRTRSLCLSEPKPIRDAQEDAEWPRRFTVQADADPRVQFKVDLDAQQKQKYDSACACGMTSSSWVCAHPLPFYCAQPIAKQVMSNHISYLNLACFL